MDILQSYCFVGGKVENWNIILDVQNTPLIDLIKVMCDPLIESHYYID